MLLYIISFQIKIFLEEPLIFGVLFLHKLHKLLYFCTFGHYLDVTPLRMTHVLGYTLIRTAKYPHSILLALYNKIFLFHIAGILHFIN